MRATDEAKSFELNDHLVHTRRSDAKEALEVCFRWWLAIEERVRVDESQVLALFVRKFASEVGRHWGDEVIQRRDEYTLPGHIVLGRTLAA
jgi:hypothetical protein